jgi:hypothetical protein
MTLHELPGRSDILVCSRRDGTVWRLSLPGGERTKYLKTESFAAAAIDLTHDCMWFSMGEPFVVEPQRVGPGAPTNVLRRHSLSPPGTPQDFRLGFPFWRLSVSRGGTQLWTGVGVQHLPTSPVGSLPHTGCVRTPLEDGKRRSSLTTGGTLVNRRGQWSRGEACRCC